ncbi:heterokaryon incompatibility protein-domain-containing protein [Rhexocercosporidium sp. MPI-PUGE-AT-0058]|nr:heterokaryon incompatibility protein-domain-containing protein [Rhexocercosporidium sp. MPI-PUGE-AT-0058]
MEPSIRLRRRLGSDNLAATLSTEASGSGNNHASDDEDSPLGQEANITAQSDTMAQPSAQITFRDQSFPAYSVGNLLGIFPALAQIEFWGRWNPKSNICVHCEELGRWIHNADQHSRGPRFYDTKLEDNIGVATLRDCGNCQFMLHCLRKAAFTPEDRQMKAPRTPQAFMQQYQLMLYHNGVQEECVLRLESVYKKRYNIPKTKDAKPSLGFDVPRQKTYSYILASCSLVLCNADAIGDDNKKWGKYIDKDPRSANSASIVLQWLEECRNHENCPPQTEVPLPTRVIKISDMPGTNPSLWTTCGIPGKYIALSHCWGSSVPVTTTLETLKAHESEIILTDLPQSFRDAIDTAQMLGFMYLWIDSLCIIQDSVQDWASECSKMALVYANATLVVAAAAAVDSTRGFLNPRVFLQGPPIGNGSKYFLREKITSRKNQITSPLSSRAWAYQEALLAPRLLLYTSNQMSWECRHGIKDEGVNVVVSSNTSISKKQFYQTIDSPLPTSNILIDADGKQQRITNHFSLFIESVSNRLNTWYGCVEDYSLRQLTHASDKLPALSGLAFAIHDPTMGEYLAGIWSKDLGAGLFWARHTAREELYNRPFLKCHKYRAPSWSWASCEGPVNFRVEPTTFSLAIASDVTFPRRAWEKDRNAAKLLDHRILLSTSDKYGQVLEGSYITLKGFWRKMYPFDPAPTATTEHTAHGPGYLPSPHRNLVKNDGSFTIRRDHPQGLQENYTWVGTDTTPGSCVLLRLSFYRCLILKSVGNNSWERDGCCILPDNSYSGWAKSQFKLV